MDVEGKVIQPLTIDYASFRKRFVSKKKKSWARPMIWIDAEEPSTINRDECEGIAITNVLEQARYKFRFDPTFTRDERLQETRIAADYAYARGMNIVRFLMFILVMSDEHSKRLLLLSGWKGFILADVAKSGEKFHIYNRADNYNERDIKRYVAGMRKACPGRPYNKSNCDGHITANHGVCWHCLQLYGATRDLWPNWLVALVQDDDREYRRRAIEALYHREVNEETAIAA